MSEGHFHLKLNRADTAVGDLPAFTQDDLVAAPTLSRGDWQDTVNEVKVQFAERVWASALAVVGPAPGNPLIPAENDGHGILETPAGTKTFVTVASTHIAGRQHSFWGDSLATAFFRFPEVSIIGGSLISSATFYMKVGFPTVTPGATRWYYCDDVNAAAPVSYDDLMAKPLSVVYVAEGKEANPKPGEYPGYTNTQDVTALIQGIVSKSGWIRKNPIMLIVKYTAVEEMEFISSFESSFPPFLEVWWKYA